MTNSRAPHLAIKPTHVVQALVQLSIYLYWGTFYFGVREHALSIAGQLVFAYLVQWALLKYQKKPYFLGFAPFPIVLSLNFFAWFRPEFWYGQFAMVLVAVASKEFLTWERGGKRAHIFNPSAFALSLLAITMVILGDKGILVPRDPIISFEIVPHFFLWVLVVASLSQWIAGTALVAMAASATLIAAFYLSVYTTGFSLMTSIIHANIFLAINLLITDPATTPRSNSGKIIMGFAYGLSIIFSYGFLSFMGAPGFYDKVLLVPILNYLVPYFDRIPSFPVSKFVAMATYVGLILIFINVLHDNRYLHPNLLQPKQRINPPLDERLDRKLRSQWRQYCQIQPETRSCQSWCNGSPLDCLPQPKR